MDEIILKMRQPQSPCRTCVPPKRCIGCHGDCGEYAEWKAKCDAAFEIVKKARDEERQDRIDRQKRWGRRLK